MTQVEVAGRSLTYPIEVRAASSWAAQFVVDARAAQRLVEPTGLRVVRLGGKAVATIVFVRYEDSDLDAYDEVGIAVLVRDGARRSPAVYIHHLPVDQEFTLHAGRELWGYPKFLANIAIERRAGSTTCTLRHDDMLILRVSIRAGGPIPLPARTLPTYTHLDGVLRRTEWRMRRSHVRGRMGGASLVLGDHPIAGELRALGLPQRAFLSQSILDMHAAFDPAKVIAPE